MDGIKMTIYELLEYLDGRGLVVTDYDLIEEALSDQKLALDNYVISY